MVQAPQSIEPTGRKQNKTTFYILHTLHSHTHTRSSPFFCLRSKLLEMVEVCGGGRTP